MNKASRSMPRKASSTQQKSQKKTTAAKKVNKKTTRKLHTKTRKTVPGSSSSTQQQSNIFSQQQPQQQSTMPLIQALQTRTLTTNTRQQQQHRSSVAPQTTLNFKLTPLTMSRRFKPTKAETASNPLEAISIAVENVKEQAAEAKAEKQAKPPGKMKLMYRKYGKIAVFSYFGVYFGCMAAFPAIVHAIPTAVFDSTELIQWCRDNNHGVWAMDWISQKLDENPKIGEKVRADPKLSADIGAGLLINELSEPLRIPVSIAVMKYFGDKKAAANDAAAASTTTTADATVAEDLTPPGPIQVEIKDAKQQQQAV